MEKSRDRANCSPPPEWAAILADPGTLKILGTIDRDGRPRLAAKKLIRPGDDGLLEIWELIETSKTNANLLAAFWFGGSAAVLALTPDGRSFLIRCRPIRAIICGQEFRTRYEEARREYPGTDLAAAWLMAVDEFEEGTLERRREIEEEAHPLMIHLDRLIGRDGKMP